MNVAAAAAALPLLAAAHAHRAGARLILLFLIVILIAVGVILLLQRHRDRRPLDETTAASPEEPPSPGLAQEEEPVLVTRSPDPTSGPRAEGAISERKKELPRGRYGIGGLLRSEWTKLRTVRSTMWTLGLTVLIGVGIGALSTGLARANWLTATPAERASFDPIGRSLTGVYFGTFTIGVLGVLVMSAEYSTGTIRAVFCAAPRRPLGLAAKALVFGAVTLVICEIVAFASFFAGQAFLTAPATHAAIGSPGALRAVAESGLYLCVTGLLALGLATIIRHTAGAICAFLGILLLLPVIVAELPSSYDNDLSPYLPLRIGATIVSGPPLTNTFSPWTGLALLSAYAAAFLVIGAVFLVKRDA
jgi:ABC-2 type transport system permease protein